MYVRPNPKLRVLYVVMSAPLAAAWLIARAVYQIFQPEYHDVIVRNIVVSLMLVVVFVVSWNISLDLARTWKRFFEVYQAVKRGEIVLQTGNPDLYAIQRIAEAFNETNEGLDTSFFRWMQASPDNPDVFLAIVRGLSIEVEKKGFYTRGHSGRVACYATWTAQEMGLPPEKTERIRYSALLHDIGKIGIDDRILTKPGMLTEEELAIMKEHPVRGAQMLAPIEKLADILPGVELHHEALDGTGYPYGLKGEQIPVMARIIAVADSFDAMTMHRPYQDAMDGEYALRVLRKLAGTKLDPDAVEALARVYAAGRIHLPSSSDAQDEAEVDAMVSA